MKRTNSQRINYPQGSVSHGTMRPEDLIPAFASKLLWLAKRLAAGVSATERKAHRKLVAEIEARIAADDKADWLHHLEDGLSKPNVYYDSSDADYDLEALFESLNAYAGPYFYFGAHPGDGSDYGFWLSEDWDEDFATADSFESCGGYQCESIKVNDISEIPAGFRGEVAVVNDHGNVTLYVKTARTLREIWSVV